MKNQEERAKDIAAHQYRLYQAKILMESLLVKEVPNQQKSEEKGNNAPREDITEADLEEDNIPEFDDFDDL